MEQLPPRHIAETLFFEGCALLADGHSAKAEASFRHACELWPDFGEAQTNLGLLLEQRGEKTAAEAAYRRALALGIHSPQLFLNLGALLAAARRFAEAEAVYGQGLSLAPDSAALWSNLGVLHACQKHEDKARACYAAALASDENHASARFNLAYLLLRQGDLQAGFACLEARDWYAAFARELGEKRAIPRWQGEPVQGKTFLIVCEAGHGDMIQFCRYAAELKRRGAARVEVLCHPALVRLFASLDGADAIHPLGAALPGQRWDFWSPPLSLPHFCDTRLSTIPAQTPYLHATAADLAKWASRLPDDRPRIGLVWQGNPKFENDAERSIPHLAMLAPLYSLAGAHFFSLQKGAGEDEIRELQPSPPIVALGPDLQDFADTAAVISQLDLLISVDTAVAHLAGALGKPCWVLLPDYQTDWRWLADREDSPWYPGMRLFRQPVQGGWPALMPELAQALTRFIEGEEEGVRR